MRIPVPRDPVNKVTIFVGTLIRSGAYKLSVLTREHWSMVEGYVLTIINPFYDHSIINQA
jgi:hypothetical protein